VLTSVTLSRCSRAPVVVPKTAGVGSAGLQQLMGKGVARCMVARRIRRATRTERRRVQELLRQSRKTLADIMQSHETPTDVVK